MTAGDLKLALASPLIEDRHEVWIGNRGTCAKLAIDEARVDSKPDSARRLLLIPNENGPYIIGSRAEVDSDEFMEDDV